MGVFPVLREEALALRRLLEQRWWGGFERDGPVLRHAVPCRGTGR